MLDKGDYVLVLDRVKTNHINSYGVIIEKISPHHLRVKIISRQATLDNDNNIVRPAKTTIIDRAPESLVLLSKGGKFFDPFEVTQTKRKRPIKERWVV